MNLVTGETGFVGSRLVQALLANGRTVRGFALGSGFGLPAAGAARLQSIRGDLLDREAVARAVEGCDTVFHCAAVVPGRGSEDQTWAVNVTGTAYVVEACVRHRVRRLVHVSTDSIYGDGLTVNATEDTKIQTNYFKEGNYPASKLEGERLVRLAAERHGLDMVILRPCFIYGPGPSPATQLFAEWSGKSVKFLLDGGRSKLSVLYVDDLVAALLLAESSSAASGQCFNVSDGQIYAKRDMIGQLAHLTGRPRIIVPIPGFPVQAFFAAIHPVVKALAPSRAADVDVRRVLFAVYDHTISCQKAIDVLGYRPKVMFPEGLARTVEWLASSREGQIRAV
jgi:nucleoside-diphosphate-sugar epimerase